MAEVDRRVVGHVVPVEGVSSIAIFAKVIGTLHHRIRRGTN